jgi:branched-chain amino acid transport system permease protein
VLSNEALFFFNLLATFAPYVIVTISLNLEYGFGGVPNFGKTLAVAGGAFITGYLPGRLLASIFGIGAGLSYIDDNIRIITQVNSNLVSNVSLSLGIIALTITVVVLFGAFLGLITAYPVARLRADYLAMTFLAAGQIMLVIGNYYAPLVGGTLGVAVPDPFAFASNFSILGLSPGEMRNVFSVVVMLIVALAIFIYTQRLTQSPLGRVLRAIRDDENSALALGKDAQRNRIMVIIFASAIAAVGGALYAFYSANVISTAYSRQSWTFWPWVMVMLGGAANNLGVVAGTFIFVTVRQAIVFYRDLFAPFLPFDPVWLDLLLLGLALLLILLYRPEGLLPEKPIKTIKDKGQPPALEKGETPADKSDQPKTGKQKSSRGFGSLFKPRGSKNAKES